MPLRGINHITFCVRDLDRAIAFYSDTLGGVVRHQWARGAYLDIGGLWVCLELADTVSPRDDDSHTAFDCDAADFATLAARISASSTHWKDNRSEGASLYFLDPDGHKLELHVGSLQDRLSHYERTKP